MNSLVIFDLDGTLADTAPDLLATLNRVTRPHGVSPMELSHIGQIVGHGAKAMIGRAFQIDQKPLDASLHELLLNEFLDDYRQNLANDTKLFDGVVTAIDTLAEAGHKFAVCTNKKHAMAVPLLQQLGVAERFEAITGGDSFVFRKPDPRHLSETARLAGFDINSAIMIGDSETDINAARNANIPSIAVSFGYSETPANQLGANQVISHFDHLPQAVSNLLQRH